MKNGKLVTATIADIHIGKKSAERLRKELEEGFLKYIEDEKDHLDLVTIAGDYFDRIIRFNEPAGVLALDTLDRIIETAKNGHFLVRIIQGTKSHDNNQLDVFNSYEETYPDILKIITKVTKETINLKGHELKVLYLPEEYPTDPDSYYKDYFSDHYDLIYGHGMTDIVGFSFSDWKDEGENISFGTPVHNTDKLLDLSSGPVMFGHIHNKKSYKDKFYYTGSYSRYAFDSQEPKGWLVSEINPDDTSDYTVEFKENKLAPTYGIIEVDTLPLEEGTDLLELLKTMSSMYDYSKIISSDDNKLKIIRQLSEGSNDIKVQTAKKIETERVDEKFNFILENKLSTAETVKRYLEVTDEVEPEDIPPLDVIDMIINPNKDYDYLDVLEHLKTKKETE